MKSSICFFFFSLWFFSYSISSALTLSLSKKIELKTSNWKIIEAIDGDTLKVEIPSMLPLKYSIRINGIDTPEKAGHAKCKEEAELAQKASEFTKNLVSNLKTFKISNVKHDKYGGRLLADVEINNIDVGRFLIKEGFARIYHGEKKLSWCN